MKELIGQTLGQYQITEIIGQGGMATVFKARQPGLERWVAVKVLPPYYAADRHFSAHFLREAQAIARLEHPHILPVYDFGQQGQYIYLVMRYIEGSRSLADVMRRPLPFAQSLAYLDQVAMALDYAHEQGVVHRDIKPTNILLDRSWIFLADFGLARLAEAGAITITDIALGTPAYMSPEQSRGAGVDARADVYALGAIVYQMLSGQIPHQAESGQAILYKRNHEPAPSLHRRDIPRLVDGIVQTALASDPADRFEGAGAFIRALRQAVETTQAGQLQTTPVQPLPAQPYPPEPGPVSPPVAPVRPPDPVRTSPGRSPWLWWLAAGLGAVVIMIVIAVGAIWLLSRQANPPFTEATPPNADSPPATLPADEILFVDEFDGVGLDNSKWVYSSGGGQIQVFNGVLQLTSAGQSFPLVYPAQNPFPAAGNFRLKVTMRYLEASERGTGMLLSAVPVAGRGTPTTGRIIEVEQDSQGWRIRVGEEGTEVFRLDAPDEKTHELDITYAAQVYRIFLDGREIYNSPVTTTRPVALWFGQPGPFEAAGEWSGLEIGRIVVEALPDTIAAAPTDTPVPAAAPTSTPDLPTATPTTPAQSCDRSAGSPFEELWSAYQSLLGCPTGDSRTLSTIAEEAFEGGHTFWIKDTDRVYIVYDRQKDGTELSEGEWQLVPSDWKWDGSNPDGVGLSPPPGLVEPKRGFGWLWRTHLNGPDGSLGWALDREYGFDNVGQAQVFERGLIFKGSMPKVYVLLANGQFYAR